MAYRVVNVDATVENIGTDTSAGAFVIDVRAGTRGPMRYTGDTHGAPVSVV